MHLISGEESLLFGIDSAGLVQMVYKLIGIRLQREVSLQYDSIKNDVNSLQEAEVGDLLFFTNNVGRIVHVGILIQSGYLIMLMEK